MEAGDRDTGLECLTLLLRFHQVAIDPAQITHQFAGSMVGVSEMLRCAKELKLKARAVTLPWPGLVKLPLPAIVERKDGGFLVVGKVSDEGVLVQDPLVNRPQVIKRADFEADWTGLVVVMTRRASLSDLARRFDITWFLQAMVKYRRLLGEVLLASFFLQLFGLVTPLFFQVVTDKVLTHRGYTTLDVLVFGLITVSIFETVLSGLRTYVFSHTTNRIDVELGARLFRHLVALPIAYFEARRVGDSVARVRELENIRNFITSSALTLVIDLGFTFVFLAVMFYYSPFLSWIVIGSFPFYVLLSAGVTPIFRKRLEAKFDRGAENQAFLVESVTAIQTLKAMAIEPQMQRRWEEQLAGYVGASFDVLSLGNWASQLVQFISKIVTALTLYFGAHLVIAGQLTVGELIAFNMLAGRVAQPVLRLAQLWQDFHQARVSIARLGDILNATPEPAFNPARAALPPIRGEVTFDHVSFRYRADAPLALHDITLMVAAGQVVGIVGPSGSGKSTLTKLAQRLYVPESGRILIDGIDLSVADVAWLRRQIGAVLQENVLFNRSIRDNIALADPGMAMERVIAAAELAGAHEFILQLPDGREAGLPILSRGEIQRRASERRKARGWHEYCRGVHWTDAKLVRALRQLHKKHGYISANLLDQNVSTPSAAYIAKRFGSLQEARILAKLPDQTRSQITVSAWKRKKESKLIRRLPGQRSKEWYLSEDILAGLRRLARRKGSVSARLIDEDIRLPSWATIAVRFGSLCQAYRLAGLIPANGSRYSRYILPPRS